MTMDHFPDEIAFADEDEEAGMEEVKRKVDLCDLKIKHFDKISDLKIEHFAKRSDPSDPKIEHFAKRSDPSDPKIEHFVKLSDPSEIKFQYHSNMTDAHHYRQSLSIKVKLEDALSGELYTDLTCVVGQPEEEVKCHSLILRLHSAVFNKSYTEKCEPEQMTFPNFTPSVFKKFLLFLYTEKFHSSVEETLGLMQIASEFQVQSLLQRCSKLVKDQIDIPNCSVIYSKVTEFGTAELQEYVCNFIVRNTDDVFKTQGFLDLSLPCLRTILSSPQKNIDQLSAFNSMIRWAREQCERYSLELNASNLVLTLDGCQELINYEQFSAAEFSEHVVDTGVLSEATALQILKKLHLNQQSTTRSSLKLSTWGLSSVSSSSSSGLSESSSDCSSPTELLPLQQPIRVQRYKNVVPQAWIRGGIEKITFMSKTGIQISGVGLLGRSELNSAGEPLPIKASITLSSFDEIAQIASARKIFPGSAESRNIDFLFESPVTLQAQHWYSLLVDTTGEVQPMGTWGRKKVKVHLGRKRALSIRFQNPKGLPPRTRTGQFPELLFTLPALDA